MNTLFCGATDGSKDVDHPKKLPSENETPNREGPTGRSDVEAELVGNITGAVLVQTYQNTIQKIILVKSELTHLAGLMPSFYMCGNSRYFLFVFQHIKSLLKRGLLLKGRIAPNGRVQNNFDNTP